MKLYQKALQLVKKAVLIAVTAFLFAVDAHAQAPANDNFANAQVLSGYTVSVTNNNENAMTETGEPAATGFNTLWYSWTAPASGQTTLTTEGSTSFNVDLTVWMGNSVTDVKSVVSVDATFPSVEFPVAAGTVYYICTGSYSSGAYGNIQLNLNLNTNSSLDTLNFIGTATTTENDNFVNRIVTSTEYGSFIAYDGSATREALEPTPGYQTIWWDYRAPANGVLDINDIGDGTWPFNKDISVWSGTTVQNLEQLVPYVENAGGDCYIPVIQGNDYQVCISSYSGATGPIMLTFSLNVNSDLNSFDLSGGASFTNDNFNSAMVLTGPTPAVVSYDAYATRQALEPANDGVQTIWFKWTATGSGTTQILTPQISQLNGADGFNKYITVYTGTAINALTQVAQAAAQYPQVNLSAIDGQTYYISVGSYSGGDGAILLSIFGQPGTNTAPSLTISQAYELQFASVTNTTYAIQSSSDLQTWNTLTNLSTGNGYLTNLVTGNGLLQQVFVAPPVGAPKLFYRATAQ